MKHSGWFSLLSFCVVISALKPAVAASFAGLEPGRSFRWEADREFGPVAVELIPGVRYRYERTGGAIAYVDVISDRESGVIDYIDIYPSCDLYQEQARKILELTGGPDRKYGLGGQLVEIYGAEGVSLYYDGTGNNSRIRFISCSAAARTEDRAVAESVVVRAPRPDNVILEIPRMGVRVREGTLPGVEVVSVADGSRAQKAGLVPGDRITEVAGFIFSDTDSDAERFREAMNVLPGAQPLTFTCDRAGAHVTVDVVLEQGETLTVRTSDPQEALNGSDADIPYLRFLRNVL